METIDWEGIEWTKVETVPAVTGILIRCDGCSNSVATVDKFTATDPEGAQVLAYWCGVCVEFAKSGRGMY